MVWQSSHKKINTNKMMTIIITMTRTKIIIYRGSDKLVTVFFWIHKWNLSFLIATTSTNCRDAVFCWLIILENYRLSMVCRVSVTCQAIGLFRAVGPLSLKFIERCSEMWTCTVFSVFFSRYVIPHVHAKW